MAAVFSVVSGEMGAALIRRDWGETLDDMAQNFPWQFAGNLQKWVGKWNDLPVDQHMLIALCAPRPVYVNGGLTDQWSDPKGEFLAMVAAGPVYRLLGQKDLGVTELPPLDTPVTGGDLAFHYHSGGHMAVPADWKAFLDFADRHFRARRRNRRETCPVHFHAARGRPVSGGAKCRVANRCTPLVWWASRQAGRERERCCDEEVVLSWASVASLCFTRGPC